MRLIPPPTPEGARTTSAVLAAGALVIIGFFGASPLKAQVFVPLIYIGALIFFIASMVCAVPVLLPARRGTTWMAWFAALQLVFLVFAAALAAADEGGIAWTASQPEATATPSPVTSVSP
ncbi:MAG TPA: hypothetical protein VF070_29530 [Streptosporangiaceae bacterium]